MNNQRVFQAFPKMHSDNSGVKGGGQGVECPPETFHREIFGDILGKMRKGKKVRKLKILRKMRKSGTVKEENEEILKK